MQVLLEWQKSKRKWRWSISFWKLDWYDVLSFENVWQINIAETDCYLLSLLSFPVTCNSSWCFWMSQSKIWKLSYFLSCTETFIVCHEKFFLFWSLEWILIFFGAWAIWGKWLKDESFFSFLNILGINFKNVVFVIFSFQWGIRLTVA